MGCHVWEHLICCSTGATGLRCDGFGLRVVSVRDPRQTQPEGGRRGRRFKHNLLTTRSVEEGGRGRHSFRNSLSLHHTTTQTQITEVCLLRAHLQCSVLHTASFFLKAEWGVAWPERWLETLAGLNKPYTCFLSGCTCSVGPQGRTLSVCPAAAVWTEPFLIRPHLAAVTASLQHMCVCVCAGCWNSLIYVFSADPRASGRFHPQPIKLQNLLKLILNMGLWKKPESHSQNYLHTHIYKSANTERKLSNKTITEQLICWIRFLSLD